MKNFRSSLLILVSLLLLISVALLATVFYHFYYRAPDYKPVVELTSKDNIIITSGSRDSLLQQFTATLQAFDNSLDSAFNNADSLNGNLDVNIGEFYKLRREISAILNNRNPVPDMKMASEKIKELQQKLTALQYINRDVENENTRLNKLLNELKAPGEISVQPAIIKQAVTKNSNNKTVAPRAFIVSDLRLTSLKLQDEKETETFSAGDTEKFTGSITVKNNYPVSNNEIMIVVVQPNGKVLQNSNWDVGTFETSQGKKIYSSKINFDYKKGEVKKLQFSLNADNFEKGTYTLQVYNNGIITGKLTKTLL